MQHYLTLTERTTTANTLVIAGALLVCSLVFLNEVLMDQSKSSLKLQQ